ncbi:hypothetical protein FG386_002910 [Cryptosporidium ryanae]|uniref:uncharacterized protein n=1 Tax=Cryptosporidium ryanae TaxID=515981 RepID=UPI00351A084B|nr:hypothetical protein FG386_002910 [Cryptosporidium ryanae]
MYAPFVVMEAYFSDAPVLIKAIQSLQLSKVNKKGTEGQLLTCEISPFGIKFSNSTLGKDVYCCCWLRKDIFKKYKYELSHLETISFDISYTTLLNCIQVFGSDAKNLVITYDQVNLHLNITNDEGSNTDCIICTYHISENNDHIYQIPELNPINNCTHFDHVVMFPNILKDLIKDISDIGRPESLVSSN